VARPAALNAYAAAGALTPLLLLALLLVGMVGAPCTPAAA
jgi:hypothetical protein